MFETLIADDAAYRAVLSTTSSLGASATSVRLGRRALVVSLISLLVAATTLLLVNGHSLNPSQGREAHLLPPDIQAAIQRSRPRSLAPTELRRAIVSTAELYLARRNPSPRPRLRRPAENCLGSPSSIDGRNLREFQRFQTEASIARSPDGLPRNARFCRGVRG